MCGYMYNRTVNNVHENNKILHFIFLFSCYYIEGTQQMF